MGIHPGPRLEPVMHELLAQVGIPVKSHDAIARFSHVAVPRNGHGAHFWVARYNPHVNGSRNGRSVPVFTGDGFGYSWTRAPLPESLDVEMDRIFYGRVFGDESPEIRGRWYNRSTPLSIGPEEFDRGVYVLDNESFLVDTLKLRFENGR